MAQCFTVYSFPSDLNITDQMVFSFIQSIDYDLNIKILTNYCVNAIDVDTFKKILEALVKKGTCGYDDGPMLYQIVSRIMENKNLAKIFGFFKVDYYVDEEGHETYDYYEYRSVDKVIKVCIKTIEEQIKILEKYGKKVKFVVE